MAKAKKTQSPNVRGKTGELITFRDHLTKFKADDNLKSSALDQYRDHILQRHRVCQVFGLNFLRAMIYCGEALLEVKSLFRHGQFKTWVEESFHSETGLSLRTCQRYMAKAREYRRFLEIQGQTVDSNASILSFLENDELFAQFSSLCVPVGNTRQDAEHWGTPDSILVATRQVLGTIDCDPCASPNFAANDPEGVAFDLKADGLSQAAKWQGNVYVAPGARVDIFPWLDKTKNSLENGHIQAAVVLLPAVFPAPIVKLLAGSPICILANAVIGKSFIEGAVSEITINQPMAVALLQETPDLNRFFVAFQKLGSVFVPYDQSTSLSETEGGSQVVNSGPARVEHSSATSLVKGQH